MKIHSFRSLLLVGLCSGYLACSSVLAQEDAGGEETAGQTLEQDGSNKKKKKEKKTEGKKPKGKAGADAAKPAVPRVVEALGKFNVFNARPNLKADYYIFLYSASWCGYCQQCMPVAMEQYRKIKGSRKVELIIICGDNSEAEAKAYLKNYKAKTPCLLFSELEATKFQGLPGAGVFGFPAISVSDKEGNVISNEIGASRVKAVLEDWRKLTLGR